MSYKIGSGFFGSDNQITSTENMDIIALHKDPSWTVFSAYKFTFKPYMDCHVKINGGEPIFLEANQIFSTDYYDASIRSFVVVEKDVLLTYIGAY